MKHDIFFDPDDHVYLVDGEEVPSVTSILQPLHRDYDKINPATLQYAANRGSAVHEALEAYDLGGELEGYPEIEGYLRAYLDWESVYRPTWTDVEQIVYNEQDSYIGTLDRAGYFNGGDVLNIVDIKTSQPTKSALVSVSLQTYAYAQAYAKDRAGSIDRWGLFLKKDGTWRFQNCREYEDKNKYLACDAWTQLLMTHHIVSLLLKTGGK